VVRDTSRSLDEILHPLDRCDHYFRTSSVPQRTTDPAAGAARTPRNSRRRMFNEGADPDKEREALKALNREIYRRGGTRSNR
jgi:hypothetical protein